MMNNYYCNEITRTKHNIEATYQMPYQMGNVRPSFRLMDEDEWTKWIQGTTTS